MIETNRIFIPVPKIKNTKVKVEVNGVDLTKRVIESTWIKPCTIGIGTFRMKLSNANGQLTGSYENGQEVKFYADNTDATTLQFWGRIDFVKDDISSEGQFLEIEGRHRSYLLTEFLVCYSATEKGTSTILSEIIALLPAGYGFTETAISSETTEMNVEWNYKPFWDCVVELCNKAGYDSYVDNDLDFHYFDENSIANDSDAIVGGDNFIRTQGFGIDDYGEKTRVTVIGQDSGGLAIIYTAISPSEGDEIKELFIKDVSANTMEKVQNSAEAKLAEVTDKDPQAIIKSYGLETVQPGDNIWIIVPRQQISGQYKILQLTHYFGMKMGGWRCDSLIEEEESTTSTVIRNIVRGANIATPAENVNKFNYSLNYNFEAEDGTFSATLISDGYLRTDGSTNGTWESPTTAVTNDATSFELRVVGESLSGVAYYVSTDGGSSFQLVSQLNTSYDFDTAGKNLRVRVELNSENIKIDSLALLYS